LEILVWVVRSHPDLLNNSEQASAYVLGLFHFQWQGYNVYIVFLELHMESSVLTLRVSAKTKSQLEKLAAATNRSKSFLASEALERYLELEAWQIKEIKLALKEADAGDFASDKDLAKAIEKYAS
jgi:RHH-type transcriptional regulator, rel operon repressor / antitoxin RelB